MKPIIFSIFGKPVAKGRPRARNAGKFVQIYTDAKTKAAEQSILAQALPYRPDTPLTGPLKVTLGFIMAIPKSKSKKWKALAGAGEILPTKKPDVDNLAKIILDPLNGIFFEDDCQVVEMHCMKAYGAVPMTNVKIEGV